ncbi:Putative uncharacterized protein [Taphrina deformans PYCC 5710]|uniref:Dipeptidyl-aminopeptidase B n=1 Tax=Taphrina deformans (strain PYCC 5710 / ATCC 11124 / CBS 356.35 / IMI 108563 / JCM 9778 / NBRC 8474) TaxID=1097556 RepID=R4XBD2_TAPDE|nr:Putative uncharacterized protein [Taphrina deformans PYCC 5710]|eukprot:CCG81671.1 Putative uncharacterized protein [Taphrina deformans PYCC 5710]
MSDPDSFDDFTVLDVAEKNARGSVDSQYDEHQHMLHRDEEEGGYVGKRRNKKVQGYTFTKKIALALAAAAFLLWVLAALDYFFSGVWKTHTHALISHSRRLTYEDVRSGRLAPKGIRVDWTDAHGEDGMYLLRKDEKIVFAHVNGTEDVFVDENDVVADQVQGKPRLPIEKYWISADMKYVLFATDVRGNWRHSFFAKYWVYEVSTKTTRSLVTDDVNAQVALASWSPTGHSIAYVLENNVYVRHKLGDAQQVTDDGSENTFNGVPDWVYEEEIFGTNSAIWWAPDSRSLAFLRTDELAVEEYPLEFFISGSDAPEIYPEVEKLKYPKPGTSNPVVDLYFVDMNEVRKPVHIKAPKDFVNSTRLITDVKWLGPERMLVRETNRDSAIQRTIIAEPRQGSVRMTQELDVKDIDGGWFEVANNAHYLPANPAHGRSEDGYLDVVISEGNLHMALFSPIDSAVPRMLTSGDFEVVGGIQAIDVERDLVYFLTTKRSALDRHLYSVSLTTGEMKAVTDDNQDGFYLTSFSPKSGFYVLGYAGPDLPWEKILSVDGSLEIMLEDNAALGKALSQYDLPQKVHSTITIDGLKMNTLELRPPSFDSSGKTKYPVLFRPYGGPTSQTGNHRFGLDWHSWLASDPTTEYVVVIVDGRGTGQMGRKLRVPVRGQLGKWEAHDQIEAARQWKKRPYVDKDKFAIWGWSFGGFLTLKVLEAGSGVFQYGMAVAPVTDWRFYDSVYTERYMGTIEDNLSGYEQTAVANVEGFKNASRFLIMHGTGDDNVHYQNTLSLVDKLNVASIENYDMHIFPDSDHSIYFHNANHQVYHRLGDWLKHAFGLRDPLAEDRSWQVHGFK